MTMTLGDVTALVIAASGIGGTYTAYRLGKRGQHNDEMQQEAATKLQKRITAFDELESLNDRLTKDIERLQLENTNLRALILEAESRGDLRLARQANRCREQLDQLGTALATLQSVVVSEIASASAQHAIDLTEQHLSDDHPDEQPDL